jgi:hypothetical protein
MTVALSHIIILKMIIISYIADYYTKDESGTIAIFMDTLKECTEKRPSEKMRIIANTFLTH